MLALKRCRAASSACSCGFSYVEIVLEEAMKAKGFLK
jgi:hypothetical protein